MAKKATTTKKETAEQKEVKKPVFVTVGDDKFEVASNFRFRSVSYTAEEAVKNEELIAELAEAKSFVLKKV